MQLKNWIAARLYRLAMTLMLKSYSVYVSVYMDRANKNLDKDLAAEIFMSIAGFNAFKVRGPIVIMIQYGELQDRQIARLEAKHAQLHMKLGV